MEYRAFFERIKANAIGGLFLFHGDEEYIKQAALAQLVSCIEPAARDLNMQQSHAPLAKDILEACETLPFFSDRRLIVCHQMADSEIKPLLAASHMLPDSTTLILYVRGNCKKDMLRLAPPERTVLFAPMSEQDAILFIEKQAREIGVSIKRDTARAFLDMVGVEAHTLMNELTKAADFAGRGNEITKEIIEKCVTPQIEYEYFQMLNQFLLGKKSEAMLALRRMLQDDRGNAFMLAHSFAGQIKNMLGARLLLDQGVKEREIAPRLGLRPWAARNALTGARRMSAKHLQDALLSFSSLDYLQISGRMDAERALEIAVLRYF